MAIPIVLLGGYAAYALLRPLPAPKVVVTPPVTPALVKVPVLWPAEVPAEQAAYGAKGYGLLASNGPQTPTPMASTAKVVTALAVLQRKPLKPGEQGPQIVFSDADVALYNQYVAKDGSVVPVSAGQSVSEYQALQAIMLPSANNIADTLVNWAFGSMSAYTTFANQYVDSLEMKQTTITDASGFAPGTVSTASDLVRLGSAALDNPVLTEIAGQRVATFPNVGPIYNVNTLLDRSGIIGIKTGNTEEAGGCYLAAAKITASGHDLTLITAVMAAPSLTSAMRGSLPLINGAPSQFQSIRTVRSGQAVGTVNTAWGATSKVIADQDISVTAWSGTTLPALTSNLQANPVLTAGSRVGSISLDFGGTKQSAGLKLQQSLPPPSVWWRLRHPF